MSQPKSYIVLCVSLFMAFSLFSQDQKTAEQLIFQYENENVENERELLGKIVKNVIKPEDIIYYSEILLEKAEKANDLKSLQQAYMQLGSANELLGNLNKSLTSYLTAIDLSEKLNDDDTKIKLFISLAGFYSKSGNTNKAAQYYELGIEGLRKSEDTTSMAIAQLNFGEEYFLANKYEKALELYDKSYKVFKNSNFKLGEAYVLGNKGMVYTAQGKDDLAMANLSRAVEMLNELKDNYALSAYMLDMASIHFKRGEKETAFKLAKQSLELANSYDLKQEMSKANLKISEMYESEGKFDSSFYYYKDHIIFRDSLLNIEKVKNIANLSTEFEVSQKQAEVDLLNQEKKTQRIVLFATAGALLFLGIMAFALLRRNNYIRKTNVIIEREKLRSDQLLRNILPSETAKELKERSRVEARRFESVTVMFTDFSGFTRHAEHLSPEELVSSLDFYFTHFDKLMDVYELEKIKTLGDSYMCVGGLPFPDRQHARKVISAAMDMVEFVENAKVDNPEDKTRFDIRIGISTGAVVAGVVGFKKFAYDIWGDTVNIASRMESSSENGKINISEETYKLVKDDFKCSYRGELDVKNKGLMKMYFIEGLLTKGDNHKIKDNTTADTINT